MTVSVVRTPRNHPEAVLPGLKTKATEAGVPAYLAAIEDPQRREECNTIIALLAQLGKHKTAKACLYVKRVFEIKLPILEKIVATSVAERKRRNQ